MLIKWNELKNAKRNWNNRRKLWGRIKKKTNNNNKIYYILSSCKYLWKQNKKIETNKEKYSIKKYKKENQCNF